MTKDIFSANKKSGASFLWYTEQRFIRATIPFVSKFINGHNLTLIGIVWIIGVLIFAYLAQQNIYWLWGSSVILILHWFTDSFDGAVGRYQNSGLVRWGYYMDHLLDFIFISSIFIGYGFLLRPDSILWLFGMIVVIGAFMANSFLAYSVLNKFRISYFKFGPTEGRIILIVLNTIIIYNGISYVENILPYVVAFFIIYMSATIYRTQKAVYKVDMDTKK
tara:strand:- start:585 stop:1244 length:660 start_codon:yes stop_codon:yes gene_type:complete